MKKTGIPKPWTYTPQNDDTRYNFPIGAGTPMGKAKRNNQGVVKKSSVVSGPKNKIMGFKKNITQA